MSETSDRPSRRDFVVDLGRVASVVALGTTAIPRSAEALSARVSHSIAAEGEWDLSWIDRLATATDRAVFDWPSLGTPDDSIVLQIAARYLDNCDAAYGAKKHDARAVFNIRTQAVPAALNDAAWAKYALGTEYSLKDSATQQPATHNVFWRRSPGPPPEFPSPLLEELMQRGSIILVCDFALGHLAKRLATKANRDADEVHRELRASFVPGAYAVPSGIFGLAKAQNAGCAFVRM